LGWGEGRRLNVWISNCVQEGSAERKRTHALSGTPTVGGRGPSTARPTTGLLRGYPRPVLGQPLLDLLGGLDLDLLGRALGARRRVTGGGVALGLGGVEVLDDALVVLLQDVLGDALHAEDLDVQPLPVGQRVLDVVEVLLVHLVHVHRQAAGRVEPLAAPVAFEVLRLLVRDEELEVFEVALAWMTMLGI